MSGFTSWDIGYLHPFIMDLTSFREWFCIDYPINNSTFVVDSSLFGAAGVTCITTGRKIFT